MPSYNKVQVQKGVCHTHCQQTKYLSLLMYMRDLWSSNNTSFVCFPAKHLYIRNDPATEIIFVAIVNPFYP